MLECARDGVRRLQPAEGAPAQALPAETKPPSDIPDWMTADLDTLLDGDADESVDSDDDDWGDDLNINLGF